MSGTTTELTAVRRYFDALTDGDVEAAGETMHDEVDFTSPGGRTTGRAAAVAMLDGFRVAFPDAHFELTANFHGPAGTVVTEGVYSATHTGPLRSPDGQEIPPTGKRVSIPFANIAEVEDGLITAHRAYWDQMAFLVQLGLAPG